MQEVMFIVLLVIFSCLFGINLYKMKQQNNQCKKIIDEHNKKIIFTNNTNLNIRKECYQPKDFFLMNNIGKNPCEDIENIKYVRYTSRQDFYL